ncbi:TlpA disulfide reductase family protein [Methylocystis sp. 9N]|uniref:TlpA disulfide reductase family protein n=1 Tax=Methylocystis borbori TaxID=3118750 RepID=A0ABU7XG57_9HYPH
MAKPPTPPRSPLLVAKAALITMAVGVAFVYAIGSMGGKKPPPGALEEGQSQERAAQEGASDERKAGAESCAVSAKIAESVKDLAKGEIAAMIITSKPEPVSLGAFNGPDGAPVTLAAFKGKTTLFNVWATWCAPCRAEMPALDKLQAEMGSDAFQVVAVNVDTSRLDRPKAFLEETGVKSLAYYGDPKANVFFELKQSGKGLGLPTTLLLGPDGCQIGLMNGPAVWDSADAKALIARAVEAAQ